MREASEYAGDSARIQLFISVASYASGRAKSALIDKLRENAPILANGARAYSGENGILLGEDGRQVIGHSQIGVECTLQDQSPIAA
jgi:hypothetical protein